MNKETSPITFSHRHTAHCETGVTANLLAQKGAVVSEAMVFGIGAGIFFAYLPILKVGSLPLTSYRMPPGYIFKTATKFLKVSVAQQTFRSEEKAVKALDELLDAGIPVGCQTGVYWLPYFPESMRFHFNAHNIVVYGKDGDDYLISDPVMDTEIRCSKADITRARFAKGPLAPRGRIYHIDTVPDTLDVKTAARRGIRRTCWIMRPPLGPIGARGPRYLAWAMERWLGRHGPLKASRLLGNVIRMQEEIGTGGGGFRFVYAAFLQECAELFGNDDLANLSRDMTAIGDRWREFAAKAARQCKGRGEGIQKDAFHDLAEILRDCSTRELSLFTTLAGIAGKLK